MCSFDTGGISTTHLFVVTVLSIFDIFNTFIPSNQVVSLPLFFIIYHRHALGTYASTESSKFTNKVVTLWYRSPELLLGSVAYNEMIDIWSAGCILAELLIGKALFPGKDELDQLKLIFAMLGTPSDDTWDGIQETKTESSLIRKVRKDMIPNMDAKENFDNKYGDDERFLSSQGAKSLIMRLLELNPKRRWKAEKALDSQYFRSKPIVPINPDELGSLPNFGDSHEFQTKPIRKKAKVIAQHASKKAKAAGENEKAAYEKAYHDFLDKAAKTRAAGLPFDLEDDEEGDGTTTVSSKNKDRKDEKESRKRSSRDESSSKSKSDRDREGRKRSRDRSRDRSDKDKKHRHSAADEEDEGDRNLRSSKDRKSSSHGDEKRSRTKDRHSNGATDSERRTRSEERKLEIQSDKEYDTDRAGKEKRDKHEKRRGKGRSRSRSRERSREKDKRRDERSERSNDRRRDKISDRHRDKSRDKKDKKERSRSRSRDRSRKDRKSRDERDRSSERSSRRRKDHSIEQDNESNAKDENRSRKDNEKHDNNKGRGESNKSDKRSRERDGNKRDSKERSRKSRGDRDRDRDRSRRDSSKERRRSRDRDQWHNENSHFEGRGPFDGWGGPHPDRRPNQLPPRGGWDNGYEAYGPGANWDHRGPGGPRGPPPSQQVFRDGNRRHGPR